MLRQHCTIEADIDTACTKWIADNLRVTVERVL